MNEHVEMESYIASNQISPFFHNLVTYILFSPEDGSFLAVLGLGAPLSSE